MILVIKFFIMLFQVFIELFSILILLQLFIYQEYFFIRFSLRLFQCFTELFSILNLFLLIFKQEHHFLFHYFKSQYYFHNYQWNCPNTPESLYHLIKIWSLSKEYLHFDIKTYFYLCLYARFLVIITKILWLLLVIYDFC